LKGGIDARSPKDYSAEFPVVCLRNDGKVDLTGKDVKIGNINNIAFLYGFTILKGENPSRLYSIENPFQKDPLHGLSGAELYILVEESHSPLVLRQVEEACVKCMAERRR
jgi:hypothetical protein